ncbi:MAG TPA: dienelactone hydrolase family protein [Gammaproteobacteria bacterium]|nr:dienelactone hydrolase family protein [Gammaproteobacteria bacterium]
MARFDEIEVNGSPMRICVASPGGDGPHPAVIVMCHIGGLDEFTTDRVDRLAAAGCVAAAPDVFHYHDWIEDKEARRASLRDKSIIDDIEACIAHAENVEAVDGKRLAILGHCMGGRTALLGAGNIPRIGPLVIYYGGRTMISWGGDGATPFERIRGVKGPVIGFFGLDDTEPCPEDVDKIEAEFKRHGIPCEFHRYRGAGHAFQNFLSPDRYREAAANDSWEKTLSFLSRAFG